VLPHVGTNGLWLESALGSDPERVELSGVDHALDGSLRNAQVVGHLKGTPIPLGYCGAVPKLVLKVFDLVFEISGTLFKLLMRSSELVELLESSSVLLAFDSIVSGVFR